MVCAGKCLLCRLVTVWSLGCCAVDVYANAASSMCAAAAGCVRALCSSQVRLPCVLNVCDLCV